MLVGVASISCAVTRSRSPCVTVEPSMIAIELARDLRQRLALSLVVHRRRARRHAEAVHLCEVRDQRFGEAVGEIVMSRVGGEVLHRQAASDFSLECRRRLTRSTAGALAGTAGRADG